MKEKLYDIDIYDITDEIVYKIKDDGELFVINHKNPIELEYEKIKIKFGNKLIKYLTDIKNNEEYFNNIYKNFFVIWRKIAIENNSMGLFVLLNNLTQKECYNIKNSIFSSVTNENLNESIYYKFITEFANL